ncbi:hypothetical protein PsWM33_00907 [Pseudovibrio sp. WM33]|nr:hypothetical protein PsWM33_00907 [Pseudovibrio sp. WM33]
MEIVLRKNGFSVAAVDKHADAIVHISAVGMKIGSSCAAHVRTSVMFTTLSLLPKSEYVQSGTTALVFNEISIASMILTGGFMQQRLAQAVEEHADKLSLKILRAREFQFEYR